MSENNDLLAGLDFAFDPDDLDSALLGNLDDDDLDDETENALVKLSTLDIGAFDVIDVGFNGQTINYTRQYLVQTHGKFYELGVSDYQCVLRWPHSRVDDEDVKRFIAAFRAQISRLRNENHTAKRFVAALNSYKILEDRKHVFMHMARMTEEIYASFLQMRRKEKQPRSAVSQLKDLL